MPIESPPDPAIDAAARDESARVAAAAVDPPIDDAPALTLGAIFQTWWPLAASWLLMGVEMPIVAAAISRLPNPEINLAALGGVAFPIALVIEAPIIMMLAASTALCGDAESVRVLRRFMMRLAFGLTAFAVVVSFTPLFDLIAGDLIGAPAAVVDPARLGLRCMLPWTWAIADRRFHQGILIRLGQQRQIGIGTAMRLIGTALPLGIGLLVGTIPGIIVAGAAFSLGAITEAAYARWCLARVGMEAILSAPPPAKPLTTGRLWRFYVPLAFTPLIALFSMPIGSAGISRMPEALASLAVWPALNGLGFMLRSGGVAFNEVVVRHARSAADRRLLTHTAWTLGVCTSVVIVVIAATPLSTWFFAEFSGLDAELTAIGRAGLWWAALLPITSYLHSLYQGVLVSAHRTRGIPEAVSASLLVTSLVLVIGVVWAPLPGASAAMAALASGAIAQTIWLRFRCHGLLRGRP